MAADHPHPQAAATFSPASAAAVEQSTGSAETGSAEFPVVLLEVQMHPDPGFQQRLAAQSCQFLQKHPQVEHLEELSQQTNFDPLLNLLTLPVRPESELATSSREILANRPDLASGRQEGRQEGEAAGHLTGGRLRSHRTTTGLALSAHFCHTDKANIWGCRDGRAGAGL